MTVHRAFVFPEADRQTIQWSCGGFASGCYCNAQHDPLMFLTVSDLWENELCHAGHDNVLKPQWKHMQFSPPFLILLSLLLISRVILESDPQQVVHRVALRVGPLSCLWSPAHSLRLDLCPFPPPLALPPMASISQYQCSPSAVQKSWCHFLFQGDDVPLTEQTVTQVRILPSSSPFAKLHTHAHRSQQQMMTSIDVHVYSIKCGHLCPSVVLVICISLSTFNYANKQERTVLSATSVAGCSESHCLLSCCDLPRKVKKSLPSSLVKSEGGPPLSINPHPVASPPSVSVIM